MRLIDADALKEDLTRFYDGEVTARELIDEQPTVNSWISVKDKLPDKNEEVIMCYEWTGKISGDKYREVIMDTLANLNSECRLIAWMPLPEPPKEEEKYDKG